MRERSSEPLAATGEAAPTGPGPTPSTGATRPGVATLTTSPVLAIGMNTGTGYCTQGRTVGHGQVLVNLPGRLATTRRLTPTGGTLVQRAHTAGSGMRRRTGSRSRRGRSS